MHKYFEKYPAVAFLIIMVLWVFGGSEAAAEDILSPSEPRYAITTLLASEHWQDGEYNEQHYGFGVTKSTGRHSHTMLTYLNSNDNQSLAYSYSREMARFGHFYAGIGFTVATGYDNGLFDQIMAAPYVSVGFGPVYTLHVPGVVSAIGVQIPLGTPKEVPYAN